MRKIRDVDAHIVWYWSDSSTSQTEPEEDASCNPGDLFVRKDESGRIRVWMQVLEGGWKRIQPGGWHPTLPGYLLRILPNGEPRWITKKTATTYRGREKRQANVVSTPNCL